MKKLAYFGGMCVIGAVLMLAAAGAAMVDKEKKAERASSKPKSPR